MADVRLTRDRGQQSLAPSPTQCDDRSLADVAAGQADLAWSCGPRYLAWTAGNLPIKHRPGESPSWLRRAGSG
jgi:hypothetical protein